MAQLTGKVAIVTGAASGLGLAIASLFAHEGAAVLLTDVSHEQGTDAARQIVSNGGEVSYLGCDVTSEADWHAAVNLAEDWRGRLDILVNNAGVNDRRGVLDSDRESWRRLMAVNLDGPFYGMRAAAPLIQRSGGGAIVNIASTAALSGHTFVAYSSSKWALRGLTRSAALEFASSRIRVNTVCPGLMLTNINRGQPYLEEFKKTIPLARAAATQEVAAVALFLASDASAYVTGQDFVVDGGMTAGMTVAGAVKT